MHRMKIGTPTNRLYKYRKLKQATWCCWVNNSINKWRFYNLTFSSISLSIKLMTCIIILIKMLLCCSECAFYVILSISKSRTPYFDTRSIHLILTGSNSAIYSVYIWLVNLDEIWIFPDDLLPVLANDILYSVYHHTNTNIRSY